VEDEETLRELTRDLLQDMGYSVLEAGSAASALALAQQHAGPIHLLVTDVILPRMSGREIAEHLAPQRPGMRVLYMSGYTDDAVVHHGVLSAEVAFLQKPFSIGVLARKVRETLDKPA
jgi:CheY-like chemotaxis protein